LVRCVKREYVEGVWLVELRALTSDVVLFWHQLGLAIFENSVNFRIHLPRSFFKLNKKWVFIVDITILDH
jgi:hypothetical protein